MFTLGLLVLWIVVWLIFWELDRKRRIQEIRDLRVRVYELEHDLYNAQSNISILDNDVVAIAKMISKEGK